MLAGGTPSSPGTLIVTAYCVGPSYPLNVTIVAGDTNSGSVLARSFVARCADGSFALGGGYRTSNASSVAQQNNFDVFTSQPLPSAQNQSVGWRVGMVHQAGQSDAPTTAYALCTPDLEAASIAPVDVQGGGAIGTFDLHARCMADEFTTGGGFMHSGNPLTPHRVRVDQAEKDFSEWHVQTFGERTASALAACFQIPTSAP